MKIIKIGKEAREKLKDGVDKTVDAVKITLGPYGQNAILDREFNKPIITNDGVSIADKVELSDPIENIGAEIVKSISRNTDDEVGDGTTTSMVLAQKIIEAGFKELDESNLVKKSVMHIKKEIDETCKLIVEDIRTQSKKIVNDDKIDLKLLEFVANTSVENKEIAKLLVEVFNIVGKDGLITVEEGAIKDFDYEIRKGLEFDEGFVSVYMADKDDEATVEKPYVLVTNHAVNDISQLTGIVGQLAQQGISDLVIFAKSFSDEVVEVLIRNKLENKFNVVGITGKLLEDVATLTGAEFINAEAKTQLQDTEIKQLGRADSVVAGKSKTTIVGGEGDVTERIEVLTKELKDASNYEKEKIKRKISQMSNGVGVIKIGARSEEEKSYIKLKLEDAINALKAAVEEGIVPGGGVTLNKLAEKYSDTILSEALQAPYTQIQENAGGKLEISEEVYDPAKVVIKGLENACSVAGTLLTTGTVIANAKEDE